MGEPMLAFLHKIVSNLCNPHSTTVVESDSPYVPGQREDLRRLPIKSFSTHQSHSVSTLPPELLVEIFTVVCHAEFHKFYSDKNRQNKTTAFTLGKICRYWRGIVWSTPAIWSHVFLCLALARYDSQVKLLDGWLKRSGVYPLSLILVFENEQDWSHKEPPMELISLLSSTSYRWRVISVVIPQAWYRALNDVKYNLPILEEVSTRPLSSDFGLPLSRQEPLTLFKYASALKDIRLDGYYLSKVSIPWRKLRCLTLRLIYLDECFFALSKTPNLVACRIYTLLDNDVNRVINESDIHLPFLGEMLFSNALWEDTECLVSHLTTPLLHTLELSKPEDGFDILKISPLLVQSGSRLLNLKMDAFTFDSDEVELFELLSNIPTLRKVEVAMNSNSTSISCNLFIDLLKLQPSTSRGANVEDIQPPSPALYFLPDLEMFTFAGPIDAPPGFSDLLLGVLQLRRNLTPRMSECAAFPFCWLDINTDSGWTFPLPAETKDKLEELVDDGLHLSVVFNGYSWL